MEIHELIDGCSAGDGRSWAELLRMIESEARAPIQRLLGRRNLDLSLADDLIQELYLHLRGEGIVHLRAFRGTGEPTFRAFLRSLAKRFSLNALRKWDHDRRCEARALHQARPPDRSGATEHEVRAAVRELEPLMEAADRPKLRFILGQVDELTGVSPSARTIRRWRRTCTGNMPPSSGAWEQVTVGGSKPAGGFGMIWLARSPVLL